MKRNLVIGLTLMSAAIVVAGTVYKGRQQTQESPQEVLLKASTLRNQSKYVDLTGLAKILAARETYAGSIPAFSTVSLPTWAASETALQAWCSSPEAAHSYWIRIQAAAARPWKYQVVSALVGQHTSQIRVLGQKRIFIQILNDPTPADAYSPIGGSLGTGSAILQTDVGNPPPSPK